MCSNLTISSAAGSERSRPSALRWARGPRSARTHSMKPCAGPKAPAERSMTGRARRQPWTARASMSSASVVLATTSCARGLATSYVPLAVNPTQRTAGKEERGSLTHPDEELRRAEVRVGRHVRELVVGAVRADEQRRAVATQSQRLGERSCADADVGRRAQRSQCVGLRMQPSRSAAALGVTAVQRFGSEWESCAARQLATVRRQIRHDQSPLGTADCGRSRPAMSALVGAKDNSCLRQQRLN